MTGRRAGPGRVPGPRHDLAANAVLSLTSEDYSRTIEMLNGAVADEYGKVIEGAGWYLKVMINVSDDEMEIVSCHLAEYDVPTEGGVVPGRKGSGER